MRAVLIGNYGVQNLGDEALRDYFLAAFPEIQWTVLSASARDKRHPASLPVAQKRRRELAEGPTPRTVPRLPFGLRSFFTPWWKTLRAIARADVVVFGGGSLFTDAESVFACLLWGMHVLVARIARRPIFLAFQGIGPFHTRIGEGIARFVVRQAAFLSVRDRASLDRVVAWGLNKKCIHTFDPVFSSMVKGKNDDRSQNVLTIIPRKNSGISLRSALPELLKKTDWEEIRLVLMQGEHPEEQQVASMLQTYLPFPATVRSVQTLDELLAAVSGSTLVLSERFHGALAALAQRIPFGVCVQREGDKLAELRPYVQADAASVSQLLSLVQQGEHALRAAFQLVSADPPPV